MQLEKLQPFSTENQQRLDKKFRLEWNYNSNHMEGNTLTYGETELLLIFDLTKGNHEMREYEEMKGHDVALRLVYDLVEDTERDLNENFIRQLNSLLLVRPFFKEAITPDGQPTRREIKVGDYKSFPNSVRLQNGEIFHYPSPAETPALMGDLIQWYKSNTDNAVIVAADLHYKFVCIHPFDDGNGRIARLLMNYHLLKNNLPPVIIKSEDKKSYLRALQEADAGNLESLRAFIAEKLVWSLELSLKAAEGENIDELGDWDKKLDLLKRDIEGNDILELVLTHEIGKKTTKNVIDLFLVFFTKKLEKLNNYFVEKNIILKQYRNFPKLSKVEKIVGNRVTTDRIIGFEQFSKLNTIYRFALIYQLNGYKHNGTKSFDLETTFTVLFDKYSYKILVEKDIFSFETLPYNQEPSELFFDRIANEITERLLKKVAELKN
jgi:Fic family protein